MKRVLTAVILIPIVVLALFRAPLWLFALLVLGVALLAAREYFDIAEKTGFRPMRGVTYLALVALFGTLAIGAGSIEEGPATSVHNLSWFISIAALAFLFLWPFLLAALSMRREAVSQSLGDAATSLFTLPYIGLTLFALVLQRESRFGRVFLLYLMLLVWSGDIAAYYVGRAIGRHKLAPRISPGKTWEGAIASVIGAVIIAVLLFHAVRPVVHGLGTIGLFPGNSTPSYGQADDLDRHPLFANPPFWLIVAFAFCINVVAQLGDLFESAIKRGAGIKDSGTLLPGHGGVLDRIDALLFALPVGFLFYNLML